MRKYKKNPILSLLLNERSDKNPSPIENFVLEPPKPCPFCIKTRYSYKRFWGLLRHIRCDHLVGVYGNIISFPTSKQKVIAVRKYKEKYLLEKDIPVENYEQVERFIFHYAKKGWDPSLRGLE